MAHTDPESQTSTQTIHTRGIPMYLHLAQEGYRDMEVLTQMRDAIFVRGTKRGRFGATPQTEALWSGIWQIRQHTNEMVAALRDQGGLLHLGCVSTEQTEDGEYRVLDRATALGQVNA